MSKIVSLITLPILLSLGLSACGEASEDGEALRAPSQMQMPHEHHAGAHHGMTSNDTDHGIGRIVEIDEEGRRVKLDHGPLENIGMDAMVMFFGIAGDVDLSQHDVGEEVAFMVKRGRDGSYRVFSLCNTEVEGRGCLEQ